MQVRKILALVWLGVLTGVIVGWLLDYEPKIFVFLVVMIGAALSLIWALFTIGDA